MKNKFCVSKKILLFVFTIILAISFTLLVFKLANIINQKKSVVSSKAAISNLQNYFPLGIYFLPGPESDSTFQKIQDAGVNVITGYWTTPIQLRLAQNHKIKYFGTLEYIFRNDNLSAKADYLDINCNLSSVVDLSYLTSFSSLIGFYGLDEANYFPITGDKQVSKEPCYTVHDLLMTNYSSYPIWMNYSFQTDHSLADNGTLSNPLMMMRTINNLSHATISGFDSNFVGNDSLPPMNSRDFYPTTREFVEAMKKKELGDSVNKIYIVLPAISNISLTIQQMKFQVYGAIIGGADGIFWYDDPANFYSSYWNSISDIIRELKTIMPGILGKTVKSDLSIQSLKPYAIKIGSNNKYYVFYLNRSNVEFKFKIDLKTDRKKLNNMKKLSSTKTFSVSNNTLRDTCEKLSACIYYEQ